MEDETHFEPKKKRKYVRKNAEDRKEPKKRGRPPKKIEVEELISVESEKDEIAQISENEDIPAIAIL
jgi:hypothetical protein